MITMTWQDFTVVLLKSFWYLLVAGLICLIMGVYLGGKHD